MKALAVAILSLASVVLADEFKTIKGKEYKNITVKQVEPDGIVISSKSGISKVYFTELPKEVQERFHYDAAKADAYSAEQAANQEALYRQQKESKRLRTEERARYWSEHPTPGTTHATANTAVASAPAGQTSTPDELENCYLEVRNADSGLEIQRNWETSWGSYDRDHFGRIILNIRVGTVGNTGGPVKVQWFFVGRRLSDPQQRIVYGKGEKSVVVPAKYFTECYAAAPILKSHVLNLAALGERYVSGTA